MNRDQKIQTSLTAVEKAFLNAAAQKYRRTVADYVRLAIMEKVNEDLADESSDVPVPAPVPAWADPPPSGPYQHVTDAIAHVIEFMTEENYEPTITFWKSEAGDLICEPCSAMCHLLIHTQAGRIRTSVREDLYRQLASIAPDNELIRLLNGVMWPCEWLPDGAFQDDQTVVEIAGDYLFTPDLQQAKYVLSSLADQTLPTQRNHRQE